MNTIKFVTQLEEWREARRKECEKEGFVNVKTHLSVGSLFLVYSSETMEEREFVLPESVVDILTEAEAQLFRRLIDVPAGVKTYSLRCFESERDDLREMLGLQSGKGE